MADSTSQSRPGSPIPIAELRLLQRRSDAKGLVRLALHLAAISCTLWIYAASIQLRSSWLLIAAAAVAYGFTLVTMFATMHECVHRTAFKSRRLNDSVAWFAGLLSFYNSTFFRHYHGWHHRFTQIAGKDPELDDPKPTSVRSYVLEMSALPWWLGKLRTHWNLAFGRVSSYAFLSAETAPAVVRSDRLQLLVYALGIAISVVLRRPLFVTYWLLPVAVAQPLLRFILLAEHGGCSQDDDALTNTRTTYTVFTIRLLMWNMPYHAEHHRYPALPFFTLAHAHQTLRPSLSHVAQKGYLGVHIDYLKAMTSSKPSVTNRSST
jgi:fatty acid desaturase